MVINKCLSHFTILVSFYGHSIKSLTLQYYESFDWYHLRIVVYVIRLSINQTCCFYYSSFLLIVLIRINVLVLIIIFILLIIYGKKIVVLGQEHGNKDYNIHTMEDLLSKKRQLMVGIFIQTHFCPTYQIVPFLTNKFNTIACGRTQSIN